MPNSPNFDLSATWGHFTDADTEARFQHVAFAANLRSKRWVLGILFVLNLAQVYGEAAAWASTGQPTLQTVFFLSVRVAVLAALAVLWIHLPRLHEPVVTWPRLSVCILAVLSIQFFLRNTFSLDPVPSLRFPMVVLYTLFIYLLMPIRTQWLLPLGSVLSLGAYFSIRYQAELRGHIIPLEPTLFALLVLNVVGAWMHRNRQLGERSAFIYSDLLIQTVRQEASMVSRQQEFIAILAHEVRNPLAIIRAKCQLASLYQQRHLPMATSTYTDILAMVLRIQTLFDDLMANEQAITQPQALKVVELTAHDWLTTAVKVGQWDLTRSVVVSPHNAFAKLRCDAGLLHLIVGNLSSNAAKFSAEEQPLALAVRVRGAEVGIRVRDYGPGISKQQQHLIFQKYARSPQHTTLEGYGFGLFMANSLALRMQGRISLQSTMGRGSAFTVWLPREVTPCQ